MTLLGVGILWFGWFGFNAGSAIVGVNCLAIRAATSVCDPNAGTSSHDWFQRSHQAACGMKNADAAGRFLVDIRLAVCQDDEALALEILSKRRA